MFNCKHINLISILTLKKIFTLFCVFCFILANKLNSNYEYMEVERVHNHNCNFSCFMVDGRQHLDALQTHTVSKK